MAWLIRDDEVLAAIDIVESFRERSRGLLGRDGVNGALLLRPARQVHSFGMRFPIDVAFCTGDLVVVRTLSLRPGRITRPSLRGRCAIEAQAGAFTRWSLRPGDQLEVRE
ncbi:MAG TPA: DUF192 domain-containing protein [Acidimicrobiales bacterium]|jgi:uncharacterized membrane protein (UPF0127 family)|nr:DUF192 domain-containing protein [Acidimicrobiales bacterium]